MSLRRKCHGCGRETRVVGNFCPNCQSPLERDSYDTWINNGNKPNMHDEPEVATAAPNTDHVDSDKKENGGNGMRNVIFTVLAWIGGIILLALMIYSLAGGFWAQNGHLFGFNKLETENLVVTDTATLNKVDGTLNDATGQKEVVVKEDTTLVVPNLKTDTVTAIDPEKGITVKDKTTFEKDVVVKENLIVEKDLTVKEDLVVEGDTQLKGDLTVDGNTSLNGDLTVAGDATFQGDVQVDGDLNVSGDITKNDTPNTAISTPAVPVETSTPSTPSPTSGKGEIILQPNYATIGDVKVNGIIRYDVGGSGESTIVVNKSSKAVTIFAEWGAGIQWYSDTDSLVKNELAHYNKVRLVMITDSGTTETFFTK